MIRPPVRIEPPAGLPVTVEELRRYCRIDGTDDDAHLLRLAKSAVARLDGYGGYLGRAIINQKWRQDVEGLPCATERRLRLKLPDVSSAVIMAVGLDGAETAQPAETILVQRDAVGWYVVPAPGSSWPTSVAAVEYVAGYGALPDNVDPAVRDAICMLVQSAYSLTDADATLRVENVEGVGSQGYFGPEIMRNAITGHVKDLLRHARWRPL